LFFGKAQCSTCHPAPFYLDNQMHDLHVERFLKNEAGDGPIKTFTLRGIKLMNPLIFAGTHIGQTSWTNDVDREFHPSEA
jgi:hypothetical protein